MDQLRLLPDNYCFVISTISFRFGMCGISWGCCETVFFSMYLFSVVEKLLLCIPMLIFQHHYHNLHHQTTGAYDQVDQLINGGDNNQQSTHQSSPRASSQSDVRRRGSLLAP